MPHTKLARLVHLTQESSSFDRRAVLREITDVFVQDRTYTAAELSQFNDVLCAVAIEVEEAVRAQLSARFGDDPRASRGLIRTLAFDVASVATPVLEQSRVLSDEDLLDIVKALSQDHLRAVGRRADLPEAIADVIVDRGDAGTLTILAGNDSAALSRRASEKMIAQASDDQDLLDALVTNRNIPADLLNAIYFNVSVKLRRKILERNRLLKPADLEAALAASQKRLAMRHGAVPTDYAEAEAFVRDLSARKRLSPQTLVALLREGRRTRFIVGLAHITDVPFDVANRIVERHDLDALAILCRAAHFDRAVFTTLAILTSTSEDEMARARDYGDLYIDLTPATAQRTLRFWRVRQTGADT
jgi:uncharacterized protein (DUF2336 family)